MIESGRVSECKENGQTGRLTVVAVGCLCLVLGVVTVWGWGMWWARQSERHFLALRNGKVTESIVSMEIDCNGEQVMLTDRDSITFLADAFTTLKLGGYEKKQTGRFRRLRVLFRDGECDSLSIDPNIDLTGMRVCFLRNDGTLWGDDIYYDAEFRGEPPMKVVRVLEKLIQQKKIGNSGDTGNSGGNSGDTGIRNSGDTNQY